MVEEYIDQSKPAQTIVTQCLSQESIEEDEVTLSHAQTIIMALHLLHSTHIHTHTYTIILL